MRNYSKKKRGKVFEFHEEQKLSSDTSTWYSRKHFMYSVPVAICTIHGLILNGGQAEEKCFLKGNNPVILVWLQKKMKTGL